MGRQRPEPLTAHQPQRSWGCQCARRRFRERAPHPRRPGAQRALRGVGCSPVPGRASPPLSVTRGSVGAAVGVRVHPQLVGCRCGSERHPPQGGVSQGSLPVSPWMRVTWQAPQEARMSVSCFIRRNWGGRGQSSAGVPGMQVLGAGTDNRMVSLVGTCPCWPQRQCGWAPPGQALDRGCWWSAVGTAEGLKAPEAGSLARCAGCAPPSQPWRAR